MSDRFDWFVIFAEMRTGSNFLETNLNALPGVRCLGEAFNPHFIGHPGEEHLLGITWRRREADPGLLIDRIRGQQGILAGFRYFHDHDPRVFDRIVADERCAKIVLTRNPLESFVSVKIAQRTGQWKLTNLARRRTARVHFDAAEFEEYLGRITAFRRALLSGLQQRGQTAFLLDYDDLFSLETINGLARWLGVAGRLERLETSLKRQNPGDVRDKVTNPAELRAALARIDGLDLSRPPTPGPARGPSVRSFVLGARTPVLFQPVPGTGNAAVLAWLAALEGVSADRLVTGRTRRDVRKWMRDRPEHRAFTVVEHPLARAHRVFCERILPAEGPHVMRRVRGFLQRRSGVELPEDRADPRWTAERHRAAFIAFLRLAEASLSGQTALGPHPVWASQASVIRGFSDFRPPDFILRADDIGTGLGTVAAALGVPAPAASLRAQPEEPFPLPVIRDAEVEAAAHAIWQQDYDVFGFGKSPPVVQAARPIEATRRPA